MESPSTSRKRPIMEDPDKREERLRRRREQARQRRLSEDPTQKEERLRKRRLADKARRLAKKCSAQRLEQMKAYERQKRAEETEEEREARLHRMRERLQDESEEERQARLQQMNDNQRERLQDETDEEREARLQQMSQLSWQLKSRVLMYSYATRGLGFLVRCATISRQLHVGQGRQRSGGSPLFMINHRSSYILWLCAVSPSCCVVRGANVRAFTTRIRESVMSVMLISVCVGRQ